MLSEELRCQVSVWTYQKFTRRLKRSNWLARGNLLRSVINGKPMRSADLFAPKKENDYCFGLLPVRNTTQNDSIYVQFEKAIEGKMKCIYFAGQNPMVSNPNLGNVHRGLRKLDTVIVEDLYLNETASLWERPDSPEGDPIKPEDIQTEVIFLPACSYLEREGNVHMAKRRGQEDEGNMGIYPNYGWVWPDNIHLLYNRASCDEHGNPINPDKKIICWDAAAKMWKGYDRPDVGSLTAALDTPVGQKPFRMVGEGVGRIFAASYKDVENGETCDSFSTPVDGPIPEFYEPVESPTKNALHMNPNAHFSPCVIYPCMPDLQKIGTKEEFPYVLCSSSICEHCCSGTITRHVTWLNELVKEPFIEMPKKLAEKLGIKSGDEVIVRSIRAQIKEKAMVTDRIKPLIIGGVEVFVTWQPYNWGFKGLSTGQSGNYRTRKIFICLIGRHCI